MNNFDKMSLQFTISPGVLKDIPLVNNSFKNTKEITTLILAPFTKNIKLCFEDIPIGTLKMQSLMVENPGAYDLEVLIKNLPPAEHNITLSWHKKTILSQSKEALDITWKPSSEAAWRHTFTVEYGRFLRKDVCITFKAILPKKKKLTKQQNKIMFLPKESKSLTKKQKPIRPLSTKRLSNIYESPQSYNKENFNPVKENVSASSGEIFISPLNATFNIERINDQIRRETYTINSIAFNCKSPKSDSPNMSNDSLEMPFLTPSNVTGVFTPKSSSIIRPKDLVFNFKLELDNLNFNQTSENHNISSSTYVKGNLSSETYVKDISLIASPVSTKKDSYILKSPNLLKINQVSNFLNTPKTVRNFSNHLNKENNVTKSLFTNIKGPQKRKSDSVLDISPPKRCYVKNSKQNSDHSLTLKWNKCQKPQNPQIYLDPITSVYHDEQWMERQEENFKKWLNALLTPPAELNSSVDGQAIDVSKLWQQCKKKSVPIAPSKEMVCNKFHINHQLDALRKAAVDLFKLCEIKEILAKISLLVESGKLSIREDKNIHLDIGIQKEVMTLFLSYNPLWLRIGLETMYNTNIEMSTNSDIISLTNFIMQHFFKSPFLLQKYKSVHNPKYVPAIKKFILKKFLVLVYFLDVAKCRRLIAHDPCLFCRNASLKESGEILLTFSRILLSAVGDITKFLRFSGYKLNYKQRHIHEFDYSVIQLGVDLRDGVRLTKVMEIILMKNDLIEKLRVPAISRLQKIHNMKIVFDTLLKANFQIVGDINAKDIVDGHYEKTLSFLWQIIYKFEAPRFVTSAILIQRWWKSLPIKIKRNILMKRWLLREMSARRIQQWYRRQKLAYHIQLVLDMYLKEKMFLRSVIKIQSYFKMYLQRRKYNLIRYSTICLQKYARMYLVIQKFQIKKVAIVKLQSLTRMYLTRKMYLKIKNAVICIQRAYRLKKISHEALKLKAVVTIQARLRAYIAMKAEYNRYQTIKRATNIIQVYFRSYKLMKEEHDKYIKMKIYAIIIQRRFRANMAMKLDCTKFNALKKYAVFIQRRFKANKLMKVEYNKYQTIRTAVITIQMYFRLYKVMILTHNQFITLKKCVITIQRRFRANRIMKLEYKNFNNLKKNVVVIQRRFRANKSMKLQLAHYHKLKNATIFIQKHFKSHKEMKIEYAKYQTIKTAVMTIQTHFRSYKLMKTDYNNFNILKKAIVTVQRRFQANKAMKVQHAKFINLKKYTVAVQQRFRANSIMKAERAKYHQLRNTVLFMQNQFKANKLMKIEYNRYQMIKRAAITIQTYFKSYKMMKINRNSYIILKKNVIIVQRRFRANKIMKLEHKRFNNLKKYIVIIQRSFRANRCMKMQMAHYQKLRNATIAIQKYYKAYQRMKLERNKYLKIKTSIITIQMYFRSYRIMKVDLNNFNHLKQTVTTIQRLFRANKAMKADREKFTCLKNRVIFIQRRFRANRCMKTYMAEYRKLKHAVLFTQNRFRANKMMKMECNKYQKIRTAVITIQMHYRTYRLMRKEYDKFNILKKSVITIQKRFKANKAMKLEYEWFHNLKKHVIIIQRRFRATKCMKIQLTYYQKMRNSTLLIQRHFKAYQKMKLEHKKYQIIKAAAITIQVCFRSYVLMKEEHKNFNNLKNSTVIIQRQFRANKAMKLQYTKFNDLKNSSIIIQRHFRAHRCMKIQRTNYHKLKSAALLIQHRYREYKKMKMDFYSFQYLRKMVIYIQRKYRAKKLMQLELQKYNCYKRSAIIIQKYFLLYRIMKIEYMRFQKLKQSVIIIQRRYRANVLMQRQHSTYKQIKMATITIQKWFTNILLLRRDHTRYKNIKNAAITIQRLFRANRLAKPDYKNYQNLRKATIILQRRFRANKCSRLNRNKFLIIRKSVIIIQNYSRKYLAMKKEKLEIKKTQISAATKIQAFWKGYKVRKESSETEQLRINIKKACSAALPENTLQQRKDRAIQILVHNPTLLQIIAALEDLDFITRRCKYSLLNLSYILPMQLYITIKSTNRSPAEMEASSIATSILINIYKYKCTSSVWIPNHINDLFIAMTHCCDKEDKLFSYLCTLVWLFAHNNDYKQFMCSLPNFSQRLLKIKLLCLRKQKMIEHTTYKITSFFNSPSNLKKPCLTPDWGLDYPDKPRTFTNSIQALKCILNILDIH